MEFRIADSFTDSLARLTGDEQKVVKTTAFDLQMNPANPGHNFHRLDRAKDKHFWSVRAGSASSGSTCEPRWSWPAAFRWRGRTSSISRRCSNRVNRSNRIDALRNTPPCAREFGPPCQASAQPATTSASSSTRQTGRREKGDIPN